MVSCGEPISVKGYGYDSGRKSCFRSFLPLICKIKTPDFFMNTSNFNQRQMEKYNGFVSKSENRILTACLLFWLLLCAAVLPKLYGMTLFPDEYGYWSQAAKMTGYDWSAVSAQQEYYSFGYSVLLAPVLKLFSPPVLRYQAVVVVQFLGMSLSGFLLFKTFSGNEEEKSAEYRKRAAILSGTVMFYAAYVVYAQTTMAETALTLLFLWIAYFMKGYLKNPTWFKAVWLCFLSIWLYAVHMRTVGVAFVCFFMILTGLLFQREAKGKKILHLFGILLLFGVLFWGTFLYKNSYTEWMTAGEKIYTNEVNDYRGQLKNIEYLFSLKGLWDFVVSFAGKLFYEFSASFGVFFWGIVSTGRNFWKSLKMIKNRKRPTGEMLFSVFLFLAVLAIFGVSALTCIHGSRVDTLIYGRYHEFILPCFLFLGLKEMFRTRNLKKGTASWIVFQILSYFMMQGSILIKDIHSLAYHSVTGVGYVIYLLGKDALTVMKAVYIVGCLLGIGTAVLVKYIHKSGRYGWVFMWSVLQLGIAGISCVKMIIPANEIFFQGTAGFYEIQKSVEAEGRRVVAYHVSNISDLDTLQFYMKEESVRVVPKETGINEAGIKISDYVFIDRIYTGEEVTETEEKDLEKWEEDINILRGIFDTESENDRWYIFYNK